MLITFELQGVQRTIDVSGPCFTAIDPIKGTPLGYFSNLGGAVLKHIKEASDLSHEDKEEVIELRDYIVRLDKLFNEVRGLSKEDLGSNAVFIQKEKLQKKGEPADKFRKRMAEQVEQGEIEDVEEIEDEDDLDGL